MNDDTVKRPVPWWGGLIIMAMGGAAFVLGAPLGGTMFLGFSLIVFFGAAWRQSRQVSLEESDAPTKLPPAERETVDATPEQLGMSIMDVWEPRVAFFTDGLTCLSVEELRDGGAKWTATGLDCDDAEVTVVYRGRVEDMLSLKSITLYLAHEGVTIDHGSNGVVIVMFNENMMTFMLTLDRFRYLTSIGAKQ